MRVKAIVSYDGSNYCGWQLQPNGFSIQEAIEMTLGKIQKIATHIEGSGRTDARVHSMGQVFHFDTQLRMTEEQWQKAINSNLPSDIRVDKVEFVSDSFHSRYDAKWKHYCYRINVGPYDLFNRHYELQLCKKLNVDLMKECCRLFIGTHDFTAFNGNSLEEMPNQVRTVYDLYIEEENNILSIHFYGEGFLRYMVRMLTQTLIEVGKERISVEQVRQILVQAEKETAPFNASAVGLYLMKVGYQNYEEDEM